MSKVGSFSSYKVANVTNMTIFMLVEDKNTTKFSRTVSNTAYNITLFDEIANSNSTKLTLGSNYNE